jgi:hypothetical protein
MDLVKEVQKRFKKAGFYQALLESEFLNTTEDLEPVAAEVKDEIKQFVAGRMAELMGLGNSKPAQSVQSTPNAPEPVMPRREVEVIDPTTGQPVKVNVQGQTVDNDPKRIPPPNWNDPMTLAMEQAKAEQLLMRGGGFTRVINQMTNRDDE